MSSGSHEPTSAPLGAEVSWWDRSWYQFDRWLPYVLLVAATVVGLLSPDAPPDRWPGTLALVTLTGLWVTFAYTIVPQDRRQQPLHGSIYVTGLLLLAAALMTRDMVFFVFAIVGFLHAGSLRPLPLVFVGVGATSLLINGFTWGGLSTAGEVGAFVAVVVIQTLLIGFGLVGGEKLNSLSEDRRRTVQQLEATLAENEGLHAQLVSQAREAGVRDERQRMAREIHDTLAQGLTGIVTQLEAAEQGIGDPVTARRHIGNAGALARASLAEARRSVQALAPGALAGGRLEDALDELVTEWSELSGIRATATVTGATRLRSTEVEVALYRVAQEALANVAKHADAARVGVTLSELGDTLVLDVRDDGCGFDPQLVDERLSFGLATMRQRLTALGGTLEVESRPGAGTAVSAMVSVTEVETHDG